MIRRQVCIGILMIGLVMHPADGYPPVPKGAPQAPAAVSSVVRDRFADLAVGVPYDDIPWLSLTDAGSVYIQFGSAGAFSLGPILSFTQSALGGVEPYQGSSDETNDKLGSAVASGDFDGNGYMDLAIGVRWESISTASLAGAVHVVYGFASSAYFPITKHQFWHQGTPGVDGALEDGDQFGYALAVGDFNGDGYDDLAIGVPYETIGSEVAAGCVNVLYGSPNGLATTGNQLFYQGHGDLWDTAESGDQFGQSLAAGDFDGDGCDDLAIGVPQEDVWAETAIEGGEVHVLYGSRSGLSIARQQLWQQWQLVGMGSSESGDWFGYSLAVGDFNGDHFADLAVGAPNESLLRDAADIVRAGAVNIILGSATGLTTTGDQYWHQDITDVLETAEPDDQFGYSLAVGDFNGDQCDDLAIGVRQESVGDVVRAGAVQVFYAVPGLGLTIVGQQLWHQDSINVPGVAEENDRLGTALAAGDFNGDGFEDLAVGVPDEDISGIANCGVVNIFYSSNSRLSAVGSELLSPYSGASAAYAQFGLVLATIPATANRLYLPVLLKN